MLWSLSTTSYAYSKRNSSYLPLAVTLDGYLDDGGIQMSLDLPCGSKYEGLLIKEVHTAAQKILQVAAIATYDGILCAAIPQKISLQVTAIKASKYDVIEAIDVETLYPGTVKVTRPDKIILTSATASLRVTTSKPCGTPLGILLAPSPHKNMRLGLVMLVNAASRSDCRQRSLAFQGADLDHIKQFSKITLASSSRSTSYAIAVKPIKRLQRSATHMKLHYLRYCYEAPIGLVVMPATSSNRTTRVGVLVAQSDRTCMRYFPNALPMSMHTEDLTVSRQAPIKSLPYLSKNLNYQTVDTDQTKIKAFKKRSNSKQIRFNLENASEDECQKIIGGVLKPLAPGKLGVGVITLASRNHCTKTRQQLAFHNLAINGKMISTDIIPLKIKGVSPY